jgi:hypothetical protein
MATPNIPSQLGERIEEDIELFRAFAEKNFRERKPQPPHVVRYWAYLLRDDDAADGLSVGITPKASVKFLGRNCGYCSIRVHAITSMPDELCIKRDASDAEHAFICNLPLSTISDDHRAAAMRIAKELARRSNAITCDPFRPQ